MLVKCTHKPKNSLELDITEAKTNSSEWKWNQNFATYLFILTFKLHLEVSLMCATFVPNVSYPYGREDTAGRSF